MRQTILLHLAPFLIEMQSLSGARFHFRHSSISTPSIAFFSLKYGMSLGIEAKRLVDLNPSLGLLVYLFQCIAMIGVAILILVATSSLVLGVSSCRRLDNLSSLQIFFLLSRNLKDQSVNSNIS